MMALMIVLVPLGILLGLIARAAQRAPDRYIDLMVMLEDRHTSRIVDQIVRDQTEAAEAFDKGLTQGLKEDNTND
jgi:hypothetical protein